MGRPKLTNIIVLRGDGTYKKYRTVHETMIGRAQGEFNAENSEVYVLGEKMRFAYTLTTKRTSPGLSKKKRKNHEQERSPE